VSLTVERFAGSATEWDEAVRAAPGWTHFHLYGWRGIFQSVLGHESPYLVARDAGGAIHGILPLVRVRSVLFGHYLVSVPFLNYGGPLGSDPAVRALADEAQKLARSSGVKLLELRSRHQLPLDLPASHRKITVLLDLPTDSALLFKSFDAKLRSQVRRPQKEGVEIRFGPDQVEPFFEVFSAHMRDLGTPTHSLRLFQAIAEQLPDAWFGCAWLGGKPIACGAGFRWGGEFEMTWASSLHAYSKVAPNMLVYWAFMERAVAEGLTLFNFGRCTSGSGTHRFKRQWGSRDEQLWWYQDSKTATAATPSPDDGAFSWGPRIWRRLPLPVATALGPRIVRYIP
jgi:FemAB-related protein (PEP-CTERM system-associated)